LFFECLPRDLRNFIQIMAEQGTVFDDPLATKTACSTFLMEPSSTDGSPAVCLECNLTFNHTIEQNAWRPFL